jgi:hypothetical protein
MKMKLLVTALTLAATTLFISSCNDANKPQKVEQNATSNHEVEVKEIIQATNYTYILVKENNEEVWIAIEQDENLQIGEKLYFADAMLMENFESKELGRTFDKIYFVNKISKNPIDKQAEWFKSNHNAQSTSGRKVEVEVSPLDGFSIEKLYAEKANYAGKSVKIKGVVVRFNEKIMDSNWVHLQDGTGTAEANDFDLTITTQDVVVIGDTVVFEGTINLDKDFGAGYFYPVIMENGVASKNF